jgi:hypothetical protein
VGPQNSFYKQKAPQIALAAARAEMENLFKGPRLRVSAKSPSHVVSDDRLGRVRRPVLLR